MLYYFLIVLAVTIGVSGSVLGNAIMQDKIKKELRENEDREEK